MKSKVVQIVDQSQNALALIPGILDGSRMLNIDWLASRGWVAVPRESANHFDENDAVAISRAAELLECSGCYAVSIDLLLNSPPYPLYWVPLTEEALINFNGDFRGHFNYILIPSNIDFTILCTTDDHFVIAGPKKFVETALASDIETARNLFDEFAADALWPSKTREFLLTIAKHYKVL